MWCFPILYTLIAVLTQVINMYTKAFKHLIWFGTNVLTFCAVNTSIHSMVWQSMEHRWELADLPSFSRIQYQKKKNSQTTFPTLKVDGLLKRKCNRKKSVQVQQSRIKELMTESLILMLAVTMSICQDAGKVELWLVLSTHFRDLTLFLFKSKKMLQA